LLGLALTVSLPVAAFIAAVGGLVGLVLFTLTTPEEDVRSMFGTGVITVAVVSYLLDRAATRLRARDEREARQADDRPYMLYLRSFGDDHASVPASGITRRGLWQVLTGWLIPIRSTRFEEVFTRPLAQYGPIIAVDAPGTRMPTLGAAKATLPNDDWQATVEAWAADAYAVLVSGAPSTINRGLQWELQLLAERLPHGRLVLVIGPEKKDVLWRNITGFLGAVGRYTLFASLTRRPWNDALLVLVHAPSRGWGAWYGWGARHRGAWTYTVAMDQAMAFAREVWAEPTPARDPFDGQPVTDTVQRAVDAATEAAARAGHPIDTRALLSALTDADHVGAWDRIGLFAATRARPALSTSSASEPTDTPLGRSGGGPLFSRNCAAATHIAARVSREYRLGPVPPGVLALGLVADRRTGAAYELGGLDADGHRQLVAELQHSLLDTTLEHLELIPGVDRAADDDHAGRLLAASQPPPRPVSARDRRRNRLVAAAVGVFLICAGGNAGRDAQMSEILWPALIYLAAASALAVAAIILRRRNADRHRSLATVLLIIAAVPAVLSVGLLAGAAL
jgi:hypothetical protein